MAQRCVPVRGRERELGWMRELLRSARDGQGGALVLLGAAGMGRTTLLRAMCAEATGFRTLGTTGIGAERELPLAGLHRLLEPVAGGVTRLPARQAEAVGYAVGRGGTPDQFLLCCGVYGLLTRLAETAPVLCWVDDAHWLDQLSLEVLAFAARRVAGRRVAIVLTGRPELDRVDGMLESAGSIVARVEKISRLVEQAASGPLVRIIALGAGFSKAASRFRSGKADGKK